MALHRERKKRGGGEVPRQKHGEMTVAKIIHVRASKPHPAD